MFKVGDYVLADDKYDCKVVDMGEDEEGVLWYECKLIDAPLAGSVTREFTEERLRPLD